MKTLTKKTVQIDFHRDSVTGGHQCYASLVERRYPYAIPAVRIAIPVATWSSREQVITALLDLVAHIESGEGLPSDLLDRLGEGGTMKTSLKPLMTSKTAEHYTPPKVIALALKVLGEIDLDPAADPGRAVPARQHYVPPESDGLVQEWHGRIFLNPPYGRETIALWVAKLLHEFGSGRVAEAIALLPSRTDTRWFQSVLVREVPICFVTGRLYFSNAKSGAPFPSVLAYLGQRGESFIDKFSVLGPIVRALPSGL